MKTILFQGDSITDAFRSRDDFHSGIGYPNFVEGSLGLDMPGEYKFYNRGISGNRIVDLYARIKIDAINLAPDYMSILIGVNDVWHEFNSKNGVDDEKFFKIYCMYIEEIKEALPDIKIMILEPFVAPGDSLLSVCDGKNMPAFKAEVAKRAVSARRVADKYDLAFVPLQNSLNEMSKKVDDLFYYTRDGVHPTSVFHAFIAREWLKAFDKIK